MSQMYKPPAPLKVGRAGAQPAWNRPQIMCAGKIPMTAWGGMRHLRRASVYLAKMSYPTSLTEWANYQRHGPTMNQRLAWAKGVLGRRERVVELAVGPLDDGFMIFRYSFKVAKNLHLKRQMVQIVWLGYQNLKQGPGSLFKALSLAGKIAKSIAGSFFVLPLHHAIFADILRRWVWSKYGLQGWIGSQQIFICWVVTVPFTI